MSLTRPFAKLAFALVLAASSTACDNIVGLDGDLRTEQRDLDRARRNWDAVLIRDYEYVVRRSCECYLSGVAVLVTVRNDRVFALNRESTGEFLSLAYADQYPTIDGLFDRIQYAIDRRARRVETRYDSYYGFPTDVYIDYDFGVVDDEDSYVLVAFRD